MFGVAGRVQVLLAQLATGGDRGVTSIEYALLASLIAVVISGAVALYGLSVNNLFTGIIGAF
jgi:Flp pilus assembly pilin Flp